MPDIVDDFDSYFDTLANLKDGDAEPAPVVAPVSVTPPAELVVTTPAEPVVAVPPAELIAGDPPVAPVVPSTPKQPDNTDIVARLVEALEKRPVTPAPTAPAAPQLRPIYTDEEIAELSAFEKEWPDIARAVALYRKGNSIEQKAEIYGEIGQVLGPQIANMQTVQVSHQLSELRRMIPDYDQVRDPVIAWATDAKLHPAYLRTAHNSVIQSGDPAEITDLVGRWRVATGTAAPQATGQGAPPKPAPAALAPAVIQAAAALAPVTSKRTTTASAEPSTFEDAFKAYAELKD